MTRIWFGIAVALVAVCCAVAGLTFWLLDPLELGAPRYEDAPRDEELIRIFQDNRSTFEELRLMATTDRAYVSASEIEGEIGTARKQEYRQLLSKIGHNLAVAPNYGGAVRFIFAHRGVAISPGWMKGIEYVPLGHRLIGEIAENLDRANTFPPNVYLRPITDEWFIVYQRTDD